MRFARIPAVLATTIGLWALAGCSEEQKQCPACGAGFTCNQATGQCVPVSASGCPAGGCGTNATCRQDNVCVCAAGYSDCDGNLGTTGNGCECAGMCNGATCGGLWGVKHGVRALPEKWTRPMRDTVRTGVDGFHEVKISELARQMAVVAWENQS